MPRPLPTRNHCVSPHPIQPLVRDHGTVNEVCAIVVILLCPPLSSGFLLLLHVLSAGTKYCLLPGEKPCGRAVPCRSWYCDRCGLKACRDPVLLRKTSSSARAGIQCSVFSKHESIDREKGPTRSSRCPEVTLPLPDSSPPRARSRLSPLLGAGPRQPQQSPTPRLVAAPKGTPEENLRQETLCRGVFSLYKSPYLRWKIFRGPQI